MKDPARYIFNKLPVLILLEPEGYFIYASLCFSLKNTVSYTAKTVFSTQQLFLHDPETVVDPAIHFVYFTGFLFAKQYYRHLGG
jgi:hypothetical protein